MIWTRYRFRTRSVDDFRPLIFDQRYPWWCSGFSASDAVIVAYLPNPESLTKRWPDAFDITHEECDGPKFSERFPKPDYYVQIEVVT